MDHVYRNKAHSNERVREIQFRQVKAYEDFNKKRLSDEQRSALNERVVTEARRLDKERRK